MLPEIAFFWTPKKMPFQNHYLALAPQDRFLLPQSQRLSWTAPLVRAWLEELEIQIVEMMISARKS